MNFLAHLYLSGKNKDILIGNFIADAVKGKSYKNYTKKIQIGILLHREIDTYTDAHPIVRKSKRRLHKRYKHYNGVIIDIFYDHFLAKNWRKYSEIPLAIYAENNYRFFQDNFKILPEKIQYMLPYMITHNWLVNYASKKGIERVLIGMNNRTKGISKMNLAIEDLHLFYNEFENDFFLFFEELIQFTKKKTTNLLTK